jgi:hypothetical protein
MLDRRYKVAAAHMTVMRFRQPEPGLKQLVSFLKATRDTDFGEAKINTLQLLFGNWYASAERARTLQEYHLLK